MPERTPERTTERQRQVLDALDRGLDAEAIAEELGITENTLRQLTRRLLQRFPGRVTDLPATAREAGVAFGPPRE